MRVFCCLVFCVYLAGCQTAPSPSVEVVGARVVDASSSGVSVEVALVLSNPGREPLPLKLAEYRMTVQGMGTYAYHTPAPRVVPALDAQSLMLPAAVPFESDTTERGLEGMAGRAWEVVGRVVYEPDNHMRALQTESGVPLPAVSFRGEGTFE